MTFIAPNLLYALIFVPLLLIAYIVIQRRRKQYALRYASLTLVKEALGKGPGWRRHIPPILFLLGLTAMLFALSRPQATIIQLTQQGTIILTLDISGSMLGDDVKPNRMEAAKEAARIFVDKQPATVRIGVVGFSGAAVLVQPPTTDKESVVAAIDRLQPQRATAIGSGILTSLAAIFEQQPPMPDNSFRGQLTPRPVVPPTATAAPTRMPRGVYAPASIILLSDGQSNTGPAPLDIVEEAVKRGVRIYTVGLGSVDGVVLRFGGRQVRTRLDEATLKAIAEKTDGEYFNAQNENELKQIYDKLGSELVFRPEKTEVTVFFTGAAGVFMLLAGFLSLLWFNRLP